MGKKTLKKYAPPLMAVLLIGGMTALVLSEKSFHVSNSTGVENEPVMNSMNNSQEEAVLTGPGTVNPVSLQALMQKQYDGRELKLGNVLSTNESYTRYYITYKSGALTISGIMNVPKGTPPSGGFPVLILNHGHIDTSVYTNGRGLRREQDFLARQGYAVFHSDYRNHAESDKDPDAETNLRLGYVQDVINAIYAVKNSSLAFLNKEKIGMLGHSMGGGIAINTMVVRPDLVRAVVLYAPISADYRQNFERWTERRPELAQKIVELYGSPSSSPEFWDNVSAVNFLDRVNAPVLIFHGTNDSSVPYEWSQNLERSLKLKGKDARLVTFTGESHEFGAQWSNFMEQSAEFFNRYVK